MPIVNPDALYGRRHAAVTGPRGSHIGAMSYTPATGLVYFPGGNTAIYS